MPCVAEVLTAPGLRDVRVLAGAPSTIEMTGIGFAEKLDDIGHQQSGAMVVLGVAASAAATGYRLDIALRRAAAQQVAALVLAQSAEVGPTAAALASRAGVAVLSMPAGSTIGELIVAGQRAAAGDAAAALRRVVDAQERLHNASGENGEGSVDELLATATECLGAPVRSADAVTDAITCPVFVDGQRTGTVTTDQQTGHAADAARLVVGMTAAAIERSQSAAHRDDDSPLKSRDAILSELLVAGDPHASRLADQARRLGVPVDGWHRAILLHLLADGHPPSLDFLHTLGSRSLEAVRTPGRSWHLARWDDSVVLIEMWKADPGPTAARHGLQAANDAVQAARAHFPELDMCCGVGTPHQGVQGLRATVAEARTAASRTQHPGETAGYDTAGLQPMLLEWYGSDTARQAVHELLEPLERLGGERATTAIRTLQIYLDEQRSLAKSAARLNVHRNAVAYRMRQITGLLQVDLADADQRLAVQLACRARLLR